MKTMGISSPLDDNGARNRFPDKPYDLRLLKEANSIFMVWTSLGLPPPQPVHDGVVSSPFREDRNPSFSIFENGKAFKDHATGLKGDVFKFIQIALDCDFAAAVSFLRARPRQPESSAQNSGAFRSRIGSKPKSGQSKIELPCDFSEGTELDHRALAAVRKWPSMQGIKRAATAGCLGFATMPDRMSRSNSWEQVRAWLVLDPMQRNVSARRLDGKNWNCLDGTPKSRSLKHSSKSWPVGIHLAVPDSILLVAEGEPDFIAIWSILTDTSKMYTPVGILGAGVSRLAEESGQFIDDREVVIYPHRDRAGEQACSSWAREFYRLGARKVSRVSLDPWLNLSGSDLSDVLMAASASNVPDALATNCWTSKVAPPLDGQNWEQEELDIALIEDAS